MPAFKLFSQRQKELSSGPSDILIYNELPAPFRVQVIHILTDSFGEQIEPRYGARDVENAYQTIHDILIREYGIFQLSTHKTFEERIKRFILVDKEVDNVLDAVELCFRYIQKLIKGEYIKNTIRKLNSKDAIEELNERFKQHAIGFQYETGLIIRVDSTYIHSEIVKPTLQLLFNPKFAGANEEYLKAHEHYRHGRNKESITECLKAFESTMKIICQEKGWNYNQTDTATPLVNTIFTNNLIPAHLQTQMNSFRSLLQSGIPTIRNRVGGHGQGATTISADDETTRYALNLTGSNIIYLIELSNI